jgi:hypothetical protein
LFEQDEIQKVKLIAVNTIIRKFCVILFYLFISLLCLKDFQVTPFLVAHNGLQLQVRGGIRSRNMSACTGVVNEANTCKFALHPP